MTNFNIKITANKSVAELVDEEIAKFLDNLEQSYDGEVEVEVETEGGEE